MLSRTSSASKSVIAIDLGGTKLAVALVSSQAEVLHQEALPTDLSNKVACLKQVIAAARLGQEWARGKIKAIGVSVPGLVRRDFTVWAPNLPGWQRVPLARHLQAATGLPIIVESDRNASVLGEVWRGAAMGATDAAYLIVGTGIGLGILAGGRLLRGANELSGCAGWLVLGRVTPDNSMRRLGVLEKLAAGPAIGAAGASALGHNVTSARDVFIAARAGNRAALGIIREAATHLGIAVANIISLFNPQVVVLGGGVGEAGPILLKPLRETALRWAQPLAARSVRIVSSRLHSQAALFGVARLALQSHAAFGEDKL